MAHLMSELPSLTLLDPLDPLTPVRLVTGPEGNFRIADEHQLHLGSTLEAAYS